MSCSCTMCDEVEWVMLSKIGEFQKLIIIFESSLAIGLFIQGSKALLSKDIWSP